MNGFWYKFDTWHKLPDVPLWIDRRYLWIWFKEGEEIRIPRLRWSLVAIWFGWDWTPIPRAASNLFVNAVNIPNGENLFVNAVMPEVAYCNAVEVWTKANWLPQSYLYFYNLGVFVYRYDDYMIESNGDVTHLSSQDWSGSYVFYIYANLPEDENGNFMSNCNQNVVPMMSGMFIHTKRTISDPYATTIYNTGYFTDRYPPNMYSGLSGNGNYYIGTDDSNYGFYRIYDSDYTNIGSVDGLPPLVGYPYQAYNQTSKSGATDPDWHCFDYYYFYDYSIAHFIQKDRDFTTVLELDVGNTFVLQAYAECDGFLISPASRYVSDYDWYYDGNFKKYDHYHNLLMGPIPNSIPSGNYIASSSFYTDGLAHILDTYGADARQTILDADLNVIVARTPIEGVPSPSLTRLTNYYGP